MPASDFKVTCDTFRNELKNIAGRVSDFKFLVSQAPVIPTENRGEEIANLTLAFRHLEDAAMRVGKAIQAYEGGVSPLGGPTTPTNN